MFGESASRLPEAPQSGKVGLLGKRPAADEKVWSRSANPLAGDMQIFTASGPWRKTPLYPTDSTATRTRVMRPAL